MTALPSSAASMSESIVASRHLASLAPVATGSPDVVSCIPKLSRMLWDCDSGHGVCAMRGAERLGELSMDMEPRAGASGAVGNVHGEAVTCAGLMRFYEGFMIRLQESLRVARYGCAPVRRRAGHLRLHLEHPRATRQRWRPRPRASPLCRTAADCSDATSVGGDLNWVFGSRLVAPCPFEGGMAPHPSVCMHLCTPGAAWP